MLVTGEGGVLLGILTRTTCSSEWLSLGCPSIGPFGSASTTSMTSTGASCASRSAWRACSSSGCNSITEWMAHFGITCMFRHDAAADALAQCELLLRVWPRVVPECASWRDLERFAARGRWLPGR